MFYGTRILPHALVTRPQGSYGAGKGEDVRRPRVLLADDHPMMLKGLRQLLEPVCEIVGIVMEGGGLVEAAERLRPDLVITDISMPGIDGIEATRRLQAALPGLPILNLSIHDEPSRVRAAFEAGACGYLTKTSAPDEIETAVRELIEGRFYISPSVTREMVGGTMPGAGAPAGRRRACRAPAPGAPGVVHPARA